MSSPRSGILASWMACLTLAACTTSANQSSAAASDTAARAKAASAVAATPDTTPPVTATIHDVAGRELGTVKLTESSAGISIIGMLKGLPPGPHGIHLHTIGRCQPVFDSAGGHWNPTGHEHGAQNPKGPHMGDMANLTVAADSTVTFQATSFGGTLRGPNGLLDADGAAVVIHAGPDDYKSNPSGNSGGRIACGVVVGR